MEKEAIKKTIIEMVNSIEDEKLLNRIYSIIYQLSITRSDG